MIISMYNYNFNVIDVGPFVNNFSGPPLSVIAIKQDGRIDKKRVTNK